jgi:hypothetical protein
MSENRVAIVTGAAGSIGRAMTRGLLAAGIRVAGVDRDRGPLEALAASAREQGKADDLLTIQTDLTSDAATEEITKATRTRFGRADTPCQQRRDRPRRNPAGQLAAPAQILGDHARSVAPLCRGPHDRTTGAGECRLARNDKAGLGPDHQCHDEPRHDVEHRHPDLRDIEICRSLI